MELFDATLRDSLAAWASKVSGSSSTYELEAVVLQKITRQQFTDAIRRMLRLPVAWSMVNHPEQLDISTQDFFRTTITGVESMAMYYNSNKIAEESAIVMQKRRVDDSIALDEFGPCRFNLKSENVVSDEDKVRHIQNLHTTRKGFRMKRRVSLARDDLPCVRIDLTMVKSTGKSRYATLAEASIMTALPTYEVEVEVVNASSTDALKVVRQLHLALEEVLVALGGGFPLLSASTKQRMMDEYMQAVHPDARMKHLPSDLKRFFAGPYPVTLESVHVQAPGPGTISIFDGYSVTEKADGERFLLFVASDGAMCFISNKMNMYGTGSKVDPSLAGTLMDGEFVDASKMRTGNKLFAVFDIYLRAGKDLRSLPLIGSGDGVTRISSAQQVVEALGQHGGDVTYKVKDFTAADGKGMSKACADTLRRARAGNFPYKIDGLIFTPCKVAVGADAPGAPPKWGTRWPRVFKWKPPEDNSIDFLVRFPKDGVPPRDMVVMNEGLVHRVANLYVGYNLLTDKPKRAMESLFPSHQQETKNNQQQYVPKLFSPIGGEQRQEHTCYIPLDANGVAKCLNGDEIVDNSVVEMCYTGSAKEDFSAFKWRPLRVRGDKEDSSGQITANNHKTATNVWRSIMDPVTEETLISGAVGQGRAAGEEVYYTRTGGREDSPTLSMRIFHNWIKETLLLQKYGRGRKSLLDLGCGVGGDLQKWIRAGFVDVVGLDKYESNIINPENGAYWRLSRAKLPKGARYVFMTYDVGVPLDALHVNRIQDPSDRMIMQALWGLIPRQGVKPPQLARYYAMSRDGFEVVSCQFAVHYFFENSRTLDVFVDNVARSLRVGGRFVGTCMDAQRVKDKLRSVKPGAAVQASSKDGAVLWSIRKKYEDAAAAKGGLGHAIEVYLESIDNTKEEYLVDYEELKKRLAKYNVVEEARGSFEETAEAAGKAASDMSEGEREFSYMNMWFVFSKIK
jgi:SAM-dependent methyltransferase